MRRILFWLALISPGLVPLVAPYLPFQDWPAHVAVIGAIDLLDDPAAKIETYYGFRGWLGPNRLFYALGALLSGVLPALWASNLVLALGLGALGPAMWTLCRALGADERLALAALPIALGRHLYCGFSSNAAALPALLVAFAAYWRLVDAARARAWPVVVRSAMVLLAALWFALGMHAFVYLVAAGLISFVAVLDLFRERRAAVVALAAVGASATLFPWFGRAQDAGQGGPSVLDALWNATREADRSGLLRSFWEWLFASYRYAIADDVLQGAWAVGLVVLLGAALILERRRIGPARGAMLAAAALTAVMFVILPSSVGPPVNWWGGNLRLPVIVVLLVIPAVQGSLQDGWRVWVVRSVAAVSVLAVLLALVDLARFSRTEMAGLDEVLAEIPPGQRLSALHYTPREVHEYPGEPHGYASNYYLAAKGGLVPQNLFENAGEPFSRKAWAPAPPWGMGAGFRWAQHGVGFDAFLVRINDAQPDAPFDGPNAARVELVKSAGKWRYYRASTTR